MKNDPTFEAFSDRSADPAVRGFLHRPASPSGDGLVLTHGAGGNAHGTLITELAETFCAAGFFVLRCDLPFRQARAFGPPRPGDAVQDRVGLRNAAAALGKLATKRIFLSGHSYGGRQASMLVAEDPQVAQGLLLTSYPLHPPGKPEQLRTQHLPGIRVATLVVQGDRDPFGSTAEITQAVKLIPGKTALMTVEGAGHDLGFRGKTRRDELPESVLKAFQTLVD